MEFLPALRMMVVMTVLTGLIYPLSVTAISQVVFNRQANGSLIRIDGRTVGSELLAQKFASSGYFWSRPSAGDFATVASGASNKGPTAADLQKTLNERRAALRKAHGLAADAPVPDDLVTASGSGLDPHLSPEAVRFQVKRVAAARGLNPQALEKLIIRLTEGRQLGLLGEPRVNVLRLNLALDALLAKSGGQPAGLPEPASSAAGK